MKISPRKALQTMADPRVDWDYSWPKIGTLLTMFSYRSPRTPALVKRREKYEKQPLANRSVTSQWASTLSERFPTFSNTIRHSPTLSNTLRRSPTLSNFGEPSTYNTAYNANRSMLIRCGVCIAHGHEPIRSPYYALSRI